MANGSAAAFSAGSPAERAQRMANASTAASNAGTAAEHACREEGTPLSELLSDESDESGETDQATAWDRCSPLMRWQLRMLATCIWCIWWLAKPVAVVLLVAIEVVDALLKFLQSSPTVGAKALLGYVILCIA